MKKHIHFHHQPDYWCLKIIPRKWYVQIARERKSAKRVKYGLHVGKAERVGGLWADLSIGPISW